MGSLLRGWGVVLCVAVMGAGAVRAQDAASEPTSQPAEIVAPQLTLEPEESPDSIDAWLMDAHGRPAGVFKYGPVSLFDPVWKQANKQLDKVGLSVGLAYTAVFQAASNGPGKRDAAG